MGERTATGTLLDEDELNRLASVLASGRQRGFLGPAPIRDQVERSLAFALVASSPPERALDLGSGGGLPGLALAMVFPKTTWYLLDSSPRRADWLRFALVSLGLQGHCHVRCGHAEDLAHTELRHSFDLVTARSFGRPATTVECAAPFLHLGGEILVTEPPHRREVRWPPPGLALLGLELVSTQTVGTHAGPVTLSCLQAVALCPSHYPRRVGVPRKRPLF